MRARLLSRTRHRRRRPDLAAEPVTQHIVAHGLEALVRLDKMRPAPNWCAAAVIVRDQLQNTSAATVRALAAADAEEAQDA